MRTLTGDLDLDATRFLPIDLLLRAVVVGAAVATFSVLAGYAGSVTFLGDACFLGDSAFLAGDGDLITLSTVLERVALVSCFLTDAGLVTSLAAGVLVSFLDTLAYALFTLSFEIDFNYSF